MTAEESVPADADSGAGAQALKEGTAEEKPHTLQEQTGEEKSLLEPVAETKAEDDKPAAEDAACDKGKGSGESVPEADAEVGRAPSPAPAPVPAPTNAPAINKPHAEGGLGLDEDDSMPTPTTLPKAMSPGDTLKRQIQNDAKSEAPTAATTAPPPRPKGAGVPVGGGGKGKGKVAKGGKDGVKGTPEGAPGRAPAVDMTQVPEAKSTYREGGLRTTVNTPETLVTEVEAEEVIEPEHYMYYAQQYAALAQQYAAYAQYCAQFAPQAQPAAAGAEAHSQGQGAPTATPGNKTAVTPAPQQQQQQQQQAQQKNTPIMVTPYRHNWLISGSHRGNQEGAWYDAIKGDILKTFGVVSRFVGGCRACAPVPWQE
mmetsp:Transcript_13043/g.30998  ORF Transcript_13043/g.30998 Transcript_13043/m.30998 type:complete len:370 (-) Transcript_13043:100-1209(-)|eukprot:s4253_g5.t1